MINLLEETIDCLLSVGKTTHDVKWIGCENQYWFTWKDFADIAQNINYDNGYGWSNINENLVVVGEDWWLERHEYDGAEWWEFKTLPQRPKQYKEPTKDTLKNI